MSAVARDYIYQVRIPDEKRNKPEPTLTKEKLEQYRKDIAHLLAPNNRR